MSLHQYEFEFEFALSKSFATKEQVNVKPSLSKLSSSLNHPLLD